MKKFIALALSVASLVAAAEMALAPGTMKHKYVAPNDYVTTNAWMTVSNKVDALIEQKADSKTWPSPSVVSNISASVTSNVVTKQYVEGLGIVSGEDNVVVLTNGLLKTKNDCSVTASNVNALSLNGGDMHGSIRNFNERTTPYARYDFRTSGDLYAGYSPGWQRLTGTVNARLLKLSGEYDTSTGFWCSMTFSPLGYFSFLDGGSDVGQRREHYFRLPITPDTNENVVLAKRDDIPTSADIGLIATNVVRSANCGVWDSALQVWWDPVMSNGKLTYQATTNVNLNAVN